MIRKEFIQIIRDPRTLLIMFVMPVVMLFLLGYAATNDVRNVPIAIFDQDRSQASHELLNAYRNADYFHFDFDVASVAEMKDLIDSGQIKAGLIIPPDYGLRIARGEQAQVAFVLDGSDPTVAGTALSAATLIGQTKATAVLRATLEARGQAGAIQPPIAQPSASRMRSLSCPRAAPLSCSHAAPVANCASDSACVMTSS